MYNFSDTQQDERILKALKALRRMPTYMIIEGNEEKYRKEVLEHYKVTEEAIATYISINLVEGISLDEHIIELEQKAFEFRADFLKNVEEALGLCFNEDERLQSLDRFNCLYMRAPYEIDIWVRHQVKSFNQFAQWHIEQGGWGSDFQGLDFDGFARGWALDWMYIWTGRQITDINMRRFDEAEQLATTKNAEIFPIAPFESLPNSVPAELISTPTLYISPEARQALHEAIAPFVDESQYEDLEHVLHQRTATGKITISHQQNSIVYVFRQTIEAEYCKVDKTKVRDWLLYWFQVKNKKGIKSLTTRTVYDVLTKDMKPAKNKRIPYNP